MDEIWPFLRNKNKIFGPVLVKGILEDRMRNIHSTKYSGASQLKLYKNLGDFNFKIRAKGDLTALGNYASHYPIESFQFEIIALKGTTETSRIDA